jgi:hypothetical protein
MAKPAFDPKMPFEEAKAKPAFDPSKPFEVVAEEKGPSLAEKIETGGRSAVEGITGGLSEPVFSGINAVVGNLIDAGFDAESIGEFAKQAVSKEAIKQEYEKDIARRRRLEAEMPEVALPAEIGGAVLGGLASGGLAAAGRLGTAGKVLTAAPRAVEAVAGAAAGKVPTAIGQAIARGAISAGGAEAAKGAAQIPTGVMTPEEMDIASAAKFGGLLGGGAQALVSGIKAAPGGAKKVLSALGGVNEGAIEKYLKDPQALVRAKSPEAIKDIIDAQVDELTKAVEAGEVSAKQAQSALDAAKNALKEEVAKRTDEFNAAKFNARETLAKAQTKFNEAVKLSKQSTEAAMTGGKAALRDDAVQAVTDLKEKVVQGSKKSYEILLKSGRSVEAKPAIQAAEQALEELKVQGKAPKAGASAAAYAKIQSYIDDLKQYKKPLSASDAKKKIQQLDQDWRAATDAGEFTDSEQRALRSIRKAFDEQLKSIPEYAAVMDEVATDTDLLGRANKLFGNVERAAPKIARIDLPARDLDRAVLLELGTRVGRPFERQVQAIQVGAKMALPGAAEAALTMSPEAEALRKAEMQMARMKRPGALQQALGKVETASPEAMAVMKAQQRAAQTQQIVQAAQQKIKDVGPFARPLSNISAIRTAVSGKNPEYVKFLQNLTKLSGEDFVQMISDLKLAQEFQKEFRIGSRNVNLWGLGAGGAVYALTGDPTSSLVIAGLGGGFGGMVDRFGPAMTQKILDGYLKVQGMPTVQKIEAAFAGMPVEVINQVKNDFIRTIPAVSSEQILIQPDQVESVKKDVMDSPLSSLKKAKMMKAIQSNKPVESGDLAAVMLGQKPKAPMILEAPKKDDLKIDRPDVLKALETRARQ